MSQYSIGHLTMDLFKVLSKSNYNLIHQKHGLENFDHSLGNALNNLDLYEDAIECYIEVIRLQPNSYKYGVIKARQQQLIYQDMHQFSQRNIKRQQFAAIKQQDWIVKIRTHGFALYQQGYYVDTIKFLDEAIRLDPTNLNAKTIKNQALQYEEKFIYLTEQQVEKNQPSQKIC